MDSAEARRFSQIHSDAVRLPAVTLTHGALEILGIGRQTADYHAALTGLGQEASYFVVPQTHLFSVLESWSEPEGPSRAD